MKKNIIIGLLLLMNLALVYKMKTASTTQQEITTTAKVALLHPELKEEDYKNQLIVIMPEISCVSCLRDEIGLLNRADKQNVAFYLYGENEDFLRNHGALFNYEIISDTEPLLSGVVADNPIAVKFANGEISALHKAITGNKQASQDFYVKHGLLPSLSK